MKTLAIELEDKLIESISRENGNGFCVCAECTGNNGLTVICDMDGWIDSDTGYVSVTLFKTYAFDNEGSETKCDIDIDTDRIERESTSNIREAWLEAKGIEDTRDILGWGGLYVY